jgi:hypothetical protein
MTGESPRRALLARPPIFSSAVSAAAPRSRWCSRFDGAVEGPLSATRPYRPLSAQKQPFPRQPKIARKLAHLSLRLHYAKTLAARSSIRHGASIVEANDHLVTVDEVPKLHELAFRVEPRRRGPVP